MDVCDVAGWTFFFLLHRPRSPMMNTVLSKPNATHEATNLFPVWCSGISRRRARKSLSSRKITCSGQWPEIVSIVAEEYWRCLPTSICNKMREENKKILNTNSTTGLVTSFFNRMLSLPFFRLFFSSSRVIWWPIRMALTPVPNWFQYYAWTDQFYRESEIFLHFIGCWWMVYKSRRWICWIRWDWSLFICSAGKEAKDQLNNDLRAVRSNANKFQCNDLVNCPCHQHICRACRTCTQRQRYFMHLHMKQKQHTSHGELDGPLDSYMDVLLSERRKVPEQRYNSCCINYIN